jgi:predicted nucleic acid-binding protein
VSNAGPIVHLAKIGGLDLIKRIFGKVFITEEVHQEIVTRGKEIGAPDALLIEQAMKDGWIKIKKVKPPSELKKLAKNAGIEVAETCSIHLAHVEKLPILLDDAAARAFASDLRLEVVGSIGILLSALKAGLISKEETIRKLDDLSRVMWLSVDVYIGAMKALRKS